MYKLTEVFDKNKKKKKKKVVYTYRNQILSDND